MPNEMWIFLIAWWVSLILLIFEQVKITVSIWVAGLVLIGLFPPLSYEGWPIGYWFIFNKNQNGDYLWRWDAIDFWHWIGGGLMWMILILTGLMMLKEVKEKPPIKGFHAGKPRRSSRSEEG